MNSLLKSDIWTENNEITKMIVSAVVLVILHAALSPISCSKISRQKQAQAPKFATQDFDPLYRWWLFVADLDSFLEPVRNTGLIHGFGFFITIFGLQILAIFLEVLKIKEKGLNLPDHTIHTSGDGW